MGKSLFSSILTGEFSAENQAKKDLQELLKKIAMPTTIQSLIELLLNKNVITTEEFNQCEREQNVKSYKTLLKTYEEKLKNFQESDNTLANDQYSIDYCNTMINELKNKIKE